MKTRVDMEDLHKLKEKLRNVNDLDLKEIDLYENGKKVNIQYSTINRWRFTGLNNYYFFIDEFWRN